MKDCATKLFTAHLFAVFVFLVFCFGATAGESNPLSASPEDDGLAAILNPFDSTCYDWRGHIIPEWRGLYTSNPAPPATKRQKIVPAMSGLSVDPSNKLKRFFHIMLSASSTPLAEKPVKFILVLHQSEATRPGGLVKKTPC